MAVLVLVAVWVLSQARSTGKPILWLLFAGAVVALVFGVRALVMILRRAAGHTTGEPSMTERQPNDKRARAVLAWGVVDRCHHPFLGSI
jgi:hypothetical protein